MRHVGHFTIQQLAIAYGSTRQILRDSNHSFTGHVLECYFDDSHSLLLFAQQAEYFIKHFVAVRVVNENEAFASVPCDDIPF